MTRLVFEVEPLHPFVEQSAGLFRAHWSEVCPDRQDMPLAPRIELYDALEASGSLIVVVGRDAVGEIRAYSVSFADLAPHHASVLVCQSDLIYVDPAFRGREGVALVRATERAARDRGCQQMMWCGPPDTAFARLMPAMGYAVQDVIYARRLG